MEDLWKQPLDVTLEPQVMPRDALEDAMDYKTVWHAIDRLCRLIDILGIGGQRFVQRALGIRSDGYLCPSALSRNDPAVLA